MDRHRVNQVDLDQSCYSSPGQRHATTSAATQGGWGGQQLKLISTSHQFGGYRKIVPSMNFYYLYTIGKPRVTRTSSGGVSGWRLSINYDVEPEKKKCPRRLKRCQKILSWADSNDGKFSLPGLPAIFASKEDALARKRDFQDCVEDIVRGNRPVIVLFGIFLIS